MPIRILIIAAVIGAFGYWLRERVTRKHVQPRGASQIAQSRRQSESARYELYMPQMVRSMVRRGDIAAIRAWLQRSPGDKAAFFGASVAEGQPEVLAFVLRSGFDPRGGTADFVDSAHRTVAQPRLQIAFSIGCNRGNPGVVRLLMGAGANANGRDTTGLPFIAAAAMRGHIDVVRSLLDRGAIVDMPVRSSAAAPVDQTLEEVPTEERMHAANERAKLIHLNGMTALHVAAERRLPVMVGVLLAHRADPRLRSSDGYTALQLCRRGMLADPPAGSRLDAASAANERATEALLLRAGAKE